MASDAQRSGTVPVAPELLDRRLSIPGPDVAEDVPDALGELTNGDGISQPASAPVPPLGGLCGAAFGFRAAFRVV